LPAQGADFRLRISTLTPARRRRAATGCASSRFLFDQGCARLFTIQTEGGLSARGSTPAASRWTGDGPVTFDGARIPVAGGAREVLNEQLTVAAPHLLAASIGNPHCVLPLPEVSEALARQYGPLIEVEPRFRPTNVQFLQVLDRRNIRSRSGSAAPVTPSPPGARAAPRPRWPTGSGWSTVT
jgi:diaminopimelate epimerase